MGALARPLRSGDETSTGFRPDRRLSRRGLPVLPRHLEGGRGYDHPSIHDRLSEHRGLRRLQPIAFRFARLVKRRTRTAARSPRFSILGPLSREFEGYDPPAFGAGDKAEADKLCASTAGRRGGVTAVEEAA